MLEFTTLIVISLLFCFREYLHLQENLRRDNMIEELQLKLISKNSDDYIKLKNTASNTPTEEMDSISDDFVPLEEMSDDQIKEFLGKGEAK